MQEDFENLMKTLVTCLAAMTLISAPAWAADVDGKWEALIPGPQGELSFVFDFSADGEALSGKVSNEMLGETEILDGKVSGDDVSFSTKLERGPRVITFLYKGVIRGDQMEITRTIGGGSGDGRGAGAKKGGPRPGGEAGGRGRGRAGGMGQEVTFTAKRTE